MINENDEIKIWNSICHAKLKSNRPFSGPLGPMVDREKQCEYGETGVCLFWNLQHERTRVQIKGRCRLGN